MPLREYRNTILTERLKEMHCTEITAKAYLLLKKKTLCEQQTKNFHNSTFAFYIFYMYSAVFFPLFFIVHLYFTRVLLNAYCTFVFCNYFIDLFFTYFHVYIVHYFALHICILQGFFYIYILQFIFSFCRGFFCAYFTFAFCIVHFLFLNF